MSAQSPSSAVNPAKTLTVDLGYFSDSGLQTVSRTEGTAASNLSAALVTTFVTKPDEGKHEGRLHSITHTGLTGGSVSSSYGYDNQGRLMKVTSSVDGVTDYGYDSTDQVTSVTTAAPGSMTGTLSESYAYDTNGNRCHWALQNQPLMGASKPAEV